MGVEIVAHSVEVIGTHSTLLVPTSLRVRDGQVLLVSGDPNAGHTALALALSGRLRPTGGTVRLDGSADRNALRRKISVVDAPDITEPDGALTPRDVVAEGLSIAGSWSGRRKVRTWLADHELAEFAGERFENLLAHARARLLVDLAVEAHGVNALVLDRPDRHGGDPAEWYSIARGEAGRGHAVIVLCSHHSAKDLDIEAARIGAGDQAPESSTPDHDEGAR